MNINELEVVLGKYLDNKENDEMKNAYIDALDNYLKDNAIKSEVVDIVIKGIDADNGITLADKIEELSSKKAEETWKEIKASKALEKNVDMNGFKFMCTLISDAFIGGENAKSYLAKVFSSAVKLSGTKEGEVKAEAVRILREFAVESILDDTVLPAWEEIKCTPIIKENICRLFEAVIELKSFEEDKSNFARGHIVKKWVADGRKLAEEERNKKEEEKNSIPRKSSELTKLAEHFSNLEQKCYEATIEVQRLNRERENLMQRISDNEDEIRKLKKRIGKQTDIIEEKQNEVERLDKEVSAATQMNMDQVTYQENSENDLLDSIARSLRMEYQDYIESASDDMDIELGEIYREKIANIFKILEQKGIKVQK